MLYIRVFPSKKRFLKLTKKKVTLSIDSKVYDKYKAYCEENAIMLSKKIEIFMRKEVEKDEK